VTVAAVLFDLNGTLVDDLPRATRATAAALSLSGLAALSEAELGQRFRLPLKDFFTDLGVLDTDTAVEAWNAAMASEPAPAMPGAAALLQRLQGRGIRTAVVSAAGCEPVRRDLAALGLLALLDDVHCDVADKAVVLAAEVEAAQGTVIYVGDTEYDVLAARAAGARAVAFTSGYRPSYQLEQAQPWRSIARLDELDALVS
jgi:phosphoglycolate phosphatase